MHVVRADPAGLGETMAHVRHAFPSIGNGTLVTIGVFDGVHRGHQRLITGMVDAAHSSGCIAAALTFSPHPAMALADDEDRTGHAGQPLLLTTMEERVELFSALSLDLLVVLPFTPETARTPAGEFTRLLLQHLSLTELWAGSGFALGHRREGDVPFLRRLGKAEGFTVHVVEPLVWDGQAVSSSRVRRALRDGDVAQAAGCLGRPYRIAGVVVRGDGRGREIGVPTANLSPPPRRLIPGGGIYACLAHVENLGIHAAAVSIGVRPTFSDAGDEGGPVLEAHLLDFAGDLYGREVALDFCARLRDEQAFDTADALVAQIHDDIARTRAFLGDAVCIPATGADQGPPSPSSPNV